MSLSPITFAAPPALVAKLNRHAQKYKKNKKKGNTPDCDRSQANTHYTSGGQRLEVLSLAGLHRASFEYHRYVYTVNGNFRCELRMTFVQCILSAL